MNRIQIAAIAAAGFYRLGQHWPKEGRIVPQSLFTEEEWAVLVAEPNLHLTPVAGEVAVGEADALGDLVVRLRTAIAGLEGDDFQKDGKPKLDVLKERMPEDKARITAALRDQVWQGLKEPWIDPAIKPGQEPEAPPAAG